MTLHAIPVAELATLRAQLKRFANARLRDTELAEDVVQETFVAAMASKADFEGRSKLRTWLTAILQNKIMDHLRAAHRARSVIVSESDRPLASHDEDDDLQSRAHEQADFASDPIRILDARQMLENASREIGKLSRQSARALVMTDVEGRDTDEVCGELNVTPNNLWVLLHRARKAVRGGLTAQLA